MNEAVVTNVSYGGSDLPGLLDGPMDDGETPEYLRLEVYIDDSDVREPYLVRAHVDALMDGPWSWPIDRCWPFEAEIRFELWVTPVDTPDEPKPYADVDTKVGAGTVVPASSTTPQTVQLGDPQLTLEYSLRDAPDATYTEVQDPDTGETRLELDRTRAIQSAIQDFDPDDGLPFFEKAKIQRAARELGSRLDIVGRTGNSSDGFPDDAVTLSDQDDRDYCAATALLFAFSQRRPRRLVEFCRSVYSPISVEADGSTSYGYLSRSVTFTFSTSRVKEFFNAQRSGNRDRTAYQAHVDVLILLIRALLAALPEIPRTEKDQYRSVFSGLTSFEERELLDEALGIDGGSVFKNDARYQPLSEVLDAAIQASTPDEVCMLNINSLLVQGWKPRTESDLKSCPPLEGGGHTITILSMSEGSGDTYTMAYQDPWGGAYGEEMTVEKPVLERMVTSVVVTGVEGGM